MERSTAINPGPGARGFDYVAHFLDFLDGELSIEGHGRRPSKKSAPLMMGTHETKSTNDLSTRPARVVAMLSSLSYLGLPE